MKPIPIFLICSFLAVSTAFAAEINSSQNDSVSSKENSRAYLVQPGDKLFILILPEDSYLESGLKTVDDKGAIVLPLLGKFEIAGKSLDGAEKELVQIIDTDYLVNPTVKIEIKEVAQKKRENVSGNH